MEIRIGIQHSPREIVVESEQEHDTVVTSLRSAIADGSPVALTDVKGREVVLNGSAIAYAEVSSEEPRRVGFLG
jgi:predicted amidohydrolase YtcJ